MANNVIGAMNPANMNGLNKIAPIGTGSGQAGSTGEAQGIGSFADYLNSALNNVNDLQNASKVAEEKLATGEIDDIHSVTIAATKAELSLQYTLAIRNKIMDAYGEIMRMQV